MKTHKRQNLLPALLLGGVLLTSGCSTPTTSIGVTAKSDRTVLSVSSPDSTIVQCVWQQDGARVQHQNTTPFRLVLPCNSVQEISFIKPATTADVEVEIQSLTAKPNRFVMERGSSRMRLVRNGNRWGSF